MSNVLTLPSRLPHAPREPSLTLRGFGTDGRHEIVVLPKWQDAREKAISVGRWIAEQAVLSAAHPAIVAAKDEAAREAGLDGRNRAAFIPAVQNWMRRHIRYVPDPATVESLDTPLYTLRRGAADCDGCALQAALYVSAGLRCRVILWALRKGMAPTHVFIESYDPSAAHWIVSDWVARGPQLPLLEQGERIEIPVRPLGAGLGAGVQINSEQGEAVAGLSDPLEWLGDKIQDASDWLWGRGPDIDQQTRDAQGLPPGTTIRIGPDSRSDGEAGGNAGVVGRMVLATVDDLAIFLRLNGLDGVLMTAAEAGFGRRPANLDQAVRWIRLAAEDPRLRPTWQRMQFELHPATLALKAVAEKLAGQPVSSADQAVQTFDRAFALLAREHPTLAALGGGLVVGIAAGSAGTLSLLWLIKRAFG